MKLDARPYRNLSDLAPMRQLLMEGTHANIHGSYMHPGCLDWAMYISPDEQERQRNLRLWERSDDSQPSLAAWAIYLPSEGTFDLFVHPKLYGAPHHAAVMDEYVAWAEPTARAAGSGQIAPFWMFDDDTIMGQLMKERGFTVVEVDPAPPLFERTLAELPTVPLPEGFSVQGVKNLEDGQLRAQATYSAFHPTHDWEHHWARYAKFIGSATYEGENDLFVRSPDGRGAAACTIWFDPLNRVGLFEPVGTHADFQRMGLGKAVMAEGLRRMKAAGMERATVGFDPNNVAALALYSSLGFRASAYFAIYRKEL